MRAYLLLLLLLCANFALGHSASLPDSKRYDEVTWLCAHNAMSNVAEQWFLPNQYESIAEQLKKGVHAQMWDVWEHEGELKLMHGNGKLFDPGRKKLVTALAELQSYLQAQPKAIVTLILESHAKDSDIHAVIQTAGLGRMLYHHQGKQWPTLGQLRQSGQRLIILSDQKNSPFNYLWAHVVETTFQNNNAKQWQNRLHRGKAQNALFLVNHFLSNPMPSRLHAPRLNSAANMKARLKTLRQLYPHKKRPHFWVLDFATSPEVAAFIRELNEQ